MAKGYESDIDVEDITTRFRTVDTTPRNRWGFMRFPEGDTDAGLAFISRGLRSDDRIGFRFMPLNDPKKNDVFDTWLPKVAALAISPEMAAHFATREPKARL